MLRYSIITLALIAASALGIPSNYGDAKPDENGEIMLPQGFVYTEVKNPGYPGVYEGTGSTVWKFKSEADTKIQIKCEDFRITETTDCTSTHVLIDTGDSKTKYCGHYRALNVISTSNKLTVELVGNEGQAVFSCNVKNTKEPEAEIINVQQNIPVNFGSPAEPEPFFDKVWILKAEEGQQVDLTCYIDLLEEEQVCHEEVLTVDLGDGPQKHCGYETSMMFSGSSTVKVRLELDKNGKSPVRCQAESVIKMEPLENPLMEERLITEDSSEHGVKAGTKGTTCKCGWANKRPARILFGREATPNEYPWMVALRAYFGIGYASCGGSIVTKRHVITAAHCVINMNGDLRPVRPEDLMVITGAHDIRRYTPRKHYATYRTEKVFIRPEFPRLFTHDFAVIVTKENIRFSDAVGPICVSPKSIEKANNVITIMGWGKTERSQYGDGVLLKAKTKIIDRRRCRINDHEVCTQAQPSATCSGDSGGPLVWLDPDCNRYFQFALVSHGHPDCVSTPSVSTDLSYFYNWMQEKIKATYPEELTCMKQE